MNCLTYHIWEFMLHSERLGFALRLVLKVSNAIPSDTAREDWMVSPPRQEQAAARRGREQSRLIIKSPGSEGKKKKGYNFPGLGKESHGILDVPWC